MPEPVADVEVRKVCARFNWDVSSVHMLGGESYISGGGGGSSYHPCMPSGRHWLSTMLFFRPLAAISCEMQ